MAAAASGEAAAGGGSEPELFRHDPAIFVLPVGCPQQPFPGSVIGYRAEPKPAVSLTEGGGSAHVPTAANSCLIFAPMNALAQRPRASPVAPAGPCRLGAALEPPGETSMKCVFCAIRDGRLPAITLAEDERAFAVLDINPINDGHTLVIPRIHAETIFDIAEEDVVATIRLARRVAAGIANGLRPDGLNLLQNNGAAAFQSVRHFHLHLIPRWADDGKGFTWDLVPGDPHRMRETADRIRAAL